MLQGVKRPGQATEHSHWYAHGSTPPDGLHRVQRRNRTRGSPNYAWGGMQRANRPRPLGPNLSLEPALS